jgi:hypothetical protein
MAAWEIYYDGSIEVASDDYLERRMNEEGDDVEDLPIEGLDAVIIASSTRCAAGLARCTALPPINRSRG